MRKSTFQLLREASDSIEKLYLKAVEGTFLHYKHPDVRYAEQLKTVGVLDDDIQPLLKDLYNILDRTGMAHTIDSAVIVTCFVYAQGYIAVEDVKMMMSLNSVNLLSEFSDLYNEPKNSIWERIKVQGVSVTDFRKAIKMCADYE